MPRWVYKRWVWAVVTGTAVAVGLANSGTGQEAPPFKVGEVIPLHFQGMPPRQVKVLRVEKQPDGSIHTEVKDTKTGETFTIVDNPPDTPSPPKVPAPKSPETVKIPSRPATPATNVAAPAALAGQSKAGESPKEKERWPLLNKVLSIFGRDRDNPPPGMTPAGTPEPERRPLLGGRLFGPRKPTGPSLPTGNPTASPTSGAKSGSSSTPPPILPTPPGGLTGGAKPPGGGNLPAPGLPGSTAEPPLVMPPSRPANPPPPSSLPSDLTKPAPPVITIPPVSMPPSLPSVPSTPPAVPMPSTPPAVPVPITPLPIPSAPAVPPIGLPPIPIPPHGTSARPVQVVVPAGYLPPQLAFERDIEPFVIALQTMHAPSARITAAKALAEGRHRSTDGVKAVLFQAARLDPCSEVRAICITYLCDLGYFDPQFLGFIQTASQDPDELVRQAATTACAKMLRK